MQIQHVMDFIVSRCNFYCTSISRLSVSKQSSNNPILRICQGWLAFRSLLLLFLELDLVQWGDSKNDNPAEYDLGNDVQKCVCSSLASLIDQVGALRECPHDRVSYEQGIYISEASDLSMRTWDPVESQRSGRIANGHVCPNRRARLISILKMDMNCGIDSHSLCTGERATQFEEATTTSWVLRGRPRRLILRTVTVTVIGRA